MLIEQNIECELRGPEPPGRTCTPITSYFHKKKKKNKEKSPSGSLFTTKILQKAMFLTSPYLGQINRLQLKFNYKIFNVIWT